MVKKVLRATLAALALCLATTGPAAAAGNYATLQVGAVVPSNGDTTWSINAIIGHYFTPNIALEGSLGYYSTDYDYAGFGSGDLTVWPLSLSVKAGVPVQRLFPYALAGADMYFIDGEIRTPALSASDSDTAFGYHLGAGIELSLSPQVYIGLEYRYTFIETNLFGVDRELDGGSTTGTFGFRF